jgi:hypothetical protein
MISDIRERVSSYLLSGRLVEGRYTYNIHTREESQKQFL